MKKNKKKTVILKQTVYTKKGQGRGGLGWVHFYQLRTAASCKWFFKAILKDASDPHSFMSFGKAFHILVV